MKYEVANNAKTTKYSNKKYTQFHRICAIEQIKRLCNQVSSRWISAQISVFHFASTEYNEHTDYAVKSSMD